MNKSELLRLKAEIFSDLSIVFEKEKSVARVLDSMSRLATSQADHLDRSKLYPPGMVR